MALFSLKWKKRMEKIHWDHFFPFFFLSFFLSPCHFPFHFVLILLLGSVPPVFISVSLCISFFFLLSILNICSFCALIHFILTRCFINLHLSNPPRKESHLSLRPCGHYSLKTDTPTGIRRLYPMLLHLSVW